MFACESSRRPLQSWNLTLAFNSLSSTPFIGIKKCSLWIMLNGPLGHLSTNVWFQPKLLYRPIPQKWAFWTNSANPQDGQPSLKATHKYLRRTYYLWVSDLRLLAPQSATSLRPHNHPSTLKPAARYVYKSYNPDISATKFFLDLDTFPQEKPVHHRGFWHASCPCPCSGLISVQRFASSLYLWATPRGWGMSVVRLFEMSRENDHIRSLANERSENISFHRSGSDLGTKHRGQKYEEERRPCWNIVE